MRAVAEASVRRVEGTAAYPAAIRSTFDCLTALLALSLVLGSCAAEPAGPPRTSPASLPSATPFHVDDTTIVYPSPTVQGGTTFTISGRSAPGAVIEAAVVLPVCGRTSTRTTSTRSTVPADGSYRVAIAINPHWTELTVGLRFVTAESSVQSGPIPLTVLPTGRPAYCVP